MLLVDRTQAYVHHGRWIADCGRRDCANAEQLTPGQGTMHCSNCRLLQAVEWPTDAEQIDEVLNRRPVPQTRNWAPRQHRQSVSCGQPDGQSVKDLIAENIEHEVL